MWNIFLLLDYYRVFGAILCFILGAIIGSFLEVVVDRVPKGESIISPPSHCPYCGHRLEPKDLIPIVSYFILKGKCRYCGKKIPFPIIETLVALLFAFLYLKFDLGILFIKFAIFVVFLVSVSFIDLYYGIVYDAMVMPGALLGLICGFLTHTLRDSLLGVLFFGVTFALIILISKLFYKEGGMGEGDLTTGIMIGAFLGVKYGIIAFFLSFFIGAVAGMLMMVIGKKDRKSAIPFVPYLATGSVISIFLGNSIIAFYLNLFKM
uniref:Prepilin peptidase n=1 Tax=Caldisericum exile TaxID=693075 RepID=A0A7C4U0L1_9BACT